MLKKLRLTLSGILLLMFIFSLLAFFNIIHIPNSISKIPYSIPVVFIMFLLLIVSLLEKNKQLKRRA